jgi:hypothetical protein
VGYKAPLLGESLQGREFDKRLYLLDYFAFFMLWLAFQSIELYFGLAE